MKTTAMTNAQAAETLTNIVETIKALREQCNEVAERADLFASDVFKLFDAAQELEKAMAKIQAVACDCGD